MFEYEEALTENGITYAALPKGLKGKINYLKQLNAKAATDPSKAKEARALDALIADEIQDFVEKDLEEETFNPNINMPNEALIARAKALGLPETASEGEVAAKEKEIADKAAGDTAAAKVKSDAEAKAAADTAAADAAKAKTEAEEDILDDLF